MGRESLFHMLNPIYTTEEVADYLQVDVVTVRRMVARGDLPAHRIGNEYRFTTKDIKQLLDASLVKPGGEEHEEESTQEIRPEEAHRERGQTFPSNDRGFMDEIER